MRQNFILELKTLITLRLTDRPLRLIGQFIEKRPPRGRPAREQMDVPLASAQAHERCDNFPVASKGAARAAKFERAEPAALSGRV